MKTLQQLAQDALDVQNASNLSGVVHSFSKAMTDLREVQPFARTKDLNTHPIAQMWASKVHELSGMGLSDSDAFTVAYETVKAWARGDT